MSTRDVVPARRLPAARRRHQLLEVSLELFGSRGFHATSMEDIADGAGVTKPVLYQHFPSKGDLYLELIRTVGGELLDAVAAATVDEPAPYARLLAGFEAYFAFVERRTNAFRLLFGGSARGDDDFTAEVDQVERRVAETIAGLIDVDLEREHREMLGFAIVGLAEVTSRQWVLRAGGSAPTADGHGGPTRLDAAEGALQARRLADLVWAGLRALPPPGAGHPA